MMANMQDCYILYFDILGYRSFFESGKDVEELFQSVLTLAHSCMDTQSPDTFGMMGFQSKVFSDNFFISASLSLSISEDLQISILIVMAALIQIDCLYRYGLLIRGGITYGSTYIDDSFVFGSGLIKAVNLEETAFFPRLLIDDTVINRLNEFGLSSKELPYGEDYDGEQIVKSLSLFLDGESSWLVEDASNLLSGAGHCSLSELKDVIEGLIEKNCRYAPGLSDSQKIAARASIIRKHAWLIKRFNDFCLEESKPDCMVKYTLYLNPKTMRSEIILNRRSPRSLYSLSQL